MTIIQIDLKYCGTHSFFIMAPLGLKWRHIGPHSATLSQVAPFRQMNVFHSSLIDKNNSNQFG